MHAQIEPCDCVDVLARDYAYNVVNFNEATPSLAELRQLRPEISEERLKVLRERILELCLAEARNDTPAPQVNAIYPLVDQGPPTRLQRVRTHLSDDAAAIGFGAVYRQTFPVKPIEAPRYGDSGKQAKRQEIRAEDFWFLAATVGTLVLLVVACAYSRA